MTYLFFWGHQPLPDGLLGPSCLSQWWPAEFTVEGLRYRTAEHYMMWRKAMLFGDAVTAELILAADHPREVKELGRRVSNFDELLWQEIRFEAVVEGNLAKFSQSEGLRDYLCGTGDEMIVEASPVDRVWGIGMAADDPRAVDPAQWEGLNLLGFALMDVRSTLQSQSPRLGP
ncbi:NADAR family protein [Mycobacterium sp. CBMA271]|uniref:NADAR family protein n=1 Tax=unclassified Mycobacteroides TaxID=2618759 RepID=UPI0012DE941E|nr:MULTISPECIES: NADAR family protein [unclassified Mycobacteroides]MUM16443.1 hypothetical protein [Mycobacteroides sp. CBMA 326]MUM20613.1 NADAR family protein [Mycobacteroides sp. CBMA 271]